jgi:hypothetical protein
MCARNGKRRSRRPPNDLPNESGFKSCRVVDELSERLENRTARPPKPKPRGEAKPLGFRSSGCLLVSAAAVDGHLSFAVRNGTCSLVIMVFTDNLPLNRPAPMTQIVRTLILIGSLAGAALAPAKTFPAGIIRLFSTDVDNPGNSPSWTNVNLDGMRLRPGWDDVQTAPGAYNWSATDAVVSLGSQYGKTIGLSVGAGVFSPQWLYDAGATKYKLQDGSGLSMPLPWDPIFLTKWLALVRAMGARYDGNPALGYIVISGLGQNVETFLAQTAADDASLTALGGTTAWVAAAQEIISVYAEVFPTTPFFITACTPFANSDGLPALQQVVDWGVATYPGRFGIMNAGLNANSSTVYYPNSAIYTYGATQPVGFQMVCSSILDPARLGGTLGQALTKGVGLGAEFVEVYQSDADAPANQAVLANQGALLQANLDAVQTALGGLANVSTRLQVGLADHEAIIGFIVAGTGMKSVILRAIGPSLAQSGITGPLADPFLELHDATGAIIATNDNWETTEIGGVITANQQAAIRGTTIAPTDPAESAIIAELNPGAYTAVIRGANNGTGIGLAEIYDLNQAAPATIVNLSTRGFVQTGPDVLILGLIIGGSTQSNIVVRALGPSLAQDGVNDALADPTLDLHDADGALVASNDNWADTQEAEIQRSGLAPSNPHEAAIEQTLSPGSYTATLAGKSGGSGVGLVEVYEIP